MHAGPLSTALATAIDADWSLPVRYQPRLLAPTRRSLVENIFAEAIVLCMIEARRPASHEIEVVAARIWGEAQAGPKIPWRDIVPGSRRYRRMIAAARAALGDAWGYGKPP